MICGYLVIAATVAVEATIYAAYNSPQGEQFRNQFVEDMENAFQMAKGKGLKPGKTPTFAEGITTYQPSPGGNWDDDAIVKLLTKYWKKLPRSWKAVVGVTSVISTIGAAFDVQDNGKPSPLQGFLSPPEKLEPLSPNLLLIPDPSKSGDNKSCPPWKECPDGFYRTPPSGSSPSPLRTPARQNKRKLVIPI